MSVTDTLTATTLTGTTIKDFSTISGSSTSTGSFGRVEATRLSGDGADITGISAGISHDGSTADGVLTYKDGDEATVESNLTFDGTHLTLGGTSGSIILPAGGGINFGAQTGDAGGMTKELLDDYEEGTFTPVMSGDGGTAGSWSSGGSHTGTYRKVGTLVYIAVQVSGVVTEAGTGNLQITGLPFTSAQAAGGHGQALALGALYNWDIGDTAYQIGCRVNDNSTTIAFWNNIDNAADARLGWPFGSSGTKYGTISGCYIST
jgi:hypothetical protein